MAEKTGTETIGVEKADSHENFAVTAGKGDVVEAAQESDTIKYKPFTKHMLKLYAILIIPYLCGCLNGYDGSLMGGLNGMTTYLDYFDM